MKNLIIPSVVVLFSLIFLTGCSKDNDSAISTLIKKTEPIIETVDSTENSNSVLRFSESSEDQLKFIPLCDDTLKLMIDFIVKKGKNVSRKDQNEYQYAFVDSLGTRHAVIVSGHDSTGFPSPNGSFEDICSWSYKDYRTTQKKIPTNFFSWHWHQGKIYLLAPMYNEAEKKAEEEKYYNLMQVGYNEFFARFEKWQKNR